ncbi:MAG: MFS transporter [Actinomycetota bacterium]
MLKKGLRLLLTRRNFGTLMGAQFCAQAGDGVVQAAIAKLIVFGGQKGFDLESARSPDDLLRVALYVFVPYTILSPFLGVIIDRWDRRRLLFLANGFRAVALLVIGLVGTNTVSDFSLFAAFLLTLASTRLVLATKAAALPATLEETNLVEGNAVSQLGGALVQLGGAGAAFVAAKFVNASPIVIVGAIVYAGGALFALAARGLGGAPSGERLPEEVKRVVANIVRGVQEVARTPKAAASITTYFWLRLLWSFTIVGVGFIARDLLADNNIKIVLLTGGAGAIGAALGFLGADRLRARVQTTASLVVAASLVAGVVVAVLGSFTDNSGIANAALAGLTFFLGLGFFLGKISLDTMVQESLGDDFRGRAFSLYDISYNLAWVIAAGAMKIFWTNDSSGILLSAMGLVFVAGMLVLASWFKRAGLLTESHPAPVA